MRQLIHSLFAILRRQFATPIFLSRLGLAIVLSVGFLSALQAQSRGPAACQQPPCNTLELVIKPVNSNVNPNTGCETYLSQCTSCDPEHQILYDVQLHAVPLGPAFSFALDYRQLFVAVNLEVSDPTSGYYSQIDSTATFDCNKPAFEAWEYDPAPTLNVEGNMVALEMSYFTADECPENLITFQPQVISGDTLMVAHLFFVVVNAYAGETFQLDFSEFFYDAPDFNCDLSGLNAVATTASGPVTVNDPSPASSGDHKFLLVQADAPSYLPGTNEAEVDIFIKNENTSGTLQIGYLEFVVVFEDQNGNMQDPVLDVIAECNYSTQHIGDQWIYHVIYQSDAGFSLPAEDAFLLGTLNVKPPTLSNQCWVASLYFPDGDHARVGSDVDCTNLLLSQDTTNVSSATAGCASACTGGYQFAIDLVGSNQCGIDRVVQLGFVETPPNEYLVKRFKAKIHFDLSDGVSINPSSFDFGEWPCLGDTCYEIIGDSVIIFNFYYPAGHAIEFGTDFITLSLAGGGCADSVFVDYLLVDFISGDSCVPAVLPPTGFPSCSPLLGGIIVTEEEDGVEGVNVTIVPTAEETPCTFAGCTAMEMTSNYGNYSHCVCEDCKFYQVTPFLNGDPTNGVTTYDLVLINRHILNLEPLDSPYKIIAADANKSNTVTVFDIVEFRKLILGVYDTIPNNTSWRFIDNRFDFSNPANPFLDNFEAYKSQTIAPGDTANFVGIKIGDVNNTNIPNQRPLERQSVTLSWGPQPSSLSKGTTLTLPVIYTGSLPLEAYQMGLRFDPAVLKLIGPSLGDLPYSLDNFGLNRVADGEIRTLWLPMTPEDEPVQPGTTLFYLTFEVLKNIRNVSNLLQIDDSVLLGGAWESDGIEYALKFAENANERFQEPLKKGPTVTCQPNPTTGEVTFEINATDTGLARLAIFGPFGERVHLQNVTIQEGKQLVVVPALLGRPAGVYQWKLWNPNFKTKGHVIKI